MTCDEAPPAADDLPARETRVAVLPAQEGVPGMSLPARETRVAGLLQGLAWGDALGARYEAFGLLPGNALLRRRPSIGRGLAVWVPPGAWTDDTDQALGILRATLAVMAPRDGGSAVTRWSGTGNGNGGGGGGSGNAGSGGGGGAGSGGGAVSPATREAFLARVVEEWLAWYRRTGAWAMGVNTLRVLRRFRALQCRGELSMDTVRAVSEEQLRRPRRGGGNGAVMRTAPLALLGGLDDREAFELAGDVAALTHPHPEAREAAGVWTLLCRQALAEGTVDWDAAATPASDQDLWRRRLAGAGPPGANGPDGFAPTTVMDAAWCVRRALDATDPTRWLAVGTRLAVQRSRDSDTVAAVAGSLLGALAGTGDRDALPGWRRVHGGGWTGTTLDLDALGAQACAVWGLRDAR